MTVQKLYPTSYVSSTPLTVWFSSDRPGVSNNLELWRAIDERGTPDEDDYAYCGTGTTFLRLGKHLANITVTGAIARVSLCAWWKSVQDPGAVATLTMYVDDSLIESASHVVLPTYHLFQHDWTTNPVVGGAWTEEQVEGRALSGNLGDIGVCHVTNSSWELRVAKLWCEIEFTGTDDGIGVQPAAHRQKLRINHTPFRPRGRA